MPLNLCRPCACCHRLCELMCASILLCLEDIVSLESSTTSGSYNHSSVQGLAERKKWTLSPIPNQKAICRRFPLGKRKSVFFNGVTGYSNHNPGQIPHPRVAGPNKRTSFLLWAFLFLLFVFVLLCLFMLGCLVWVLLLICLILLL